MSDPLFNGRTYAENLAFLGIDSTIPITEGSGNVDWTKLLLNQLQNEAGAAGKNLNVFFAQMNKNSTDHPLPQTWEEFTRAFRRDFLGQNPPLPPEAGSTFINAFIGFAGQAGFFEGIGSVPFTLETTFANAGVNLAEQFKRGFADFLQHYPYNSNGSVGNAAAFFQNYNNYFANISVIQKNGVLFDAALNPVSGQGLTSYEEIFEQFPSPSFTDFTPSGTPIIVTPTFQERFVKFYKSYVHEHGYFATGRAFDEWAQELQSEYYQGLQTSQPVPSAGYSGVNRAVAEIVTNKTERFLFQGNISAQTLAAATAVNGVANAVAIRLQLESPETDESLERFEFDASTTGFSSTVLGITTLVIVFPPHIADSTTVGVKQAYLENALRNIKFVSESGIAGERAIVPRLVTGIAPANGIVDMDPEVFRINGVTIVDTSVTTDSTARTLVINRLFKLVAEMIDVLQQVAAAQAEYLTFLTQWQKAYTDLISEIKTFTRADGTVFGGIDATTATVQTLTTQRNDANTVNLNTREKLSNLRGVVSDTAKRIQSNVNQSQDAATQQGQFASSLIQQLSTILGAIYR